MGFSLQRDVDTHVSIFVSTPQVCNFSAAGESRVHVRSATAMREGVLKSLDDLSCPSIR